MFVLPMSFFTYDKTKKNFTADMSEIQIAAKKKNISDGFYIQSPKTLKCIFFKYDFTTQKDLLDDIESFEFTSNEGFSVTLFND